MWLRTALLQHHLLFSFSNVVRLEEGITMMSSVQVKRVMLQVKQPQKETARGLNGWQICEGALLCVRIDFDAAFSTRPSACCAVMLH